MRATIAIFFLACTGIRADGLDDEKRWKIIAELKQAYTKKLAQYQVPLEADKFRLKKYETDYKIDRVRPAEWVPPSSQDVNGTIHFASAKERNDAITRLKASIKDNADAIAALNAAPEKTIPRSIDMKYKAGWWGTFPNQTGILKRSDKTESVIERRTPNGGVELYIINAPIKGEVGKSVKVPGLFLVEDRIVIDNVDALKLKSIPFKMEEIDGKKKD